MTSGSAVNLIYDLLGCKTKTPTVVSSGQAVDDQVENVEEPTCAHLLETPWYHFSIAHRLWTSGKIELLRMTDW